LALSLLSSVNTIIFISMHQAVDSERSSLAEAFATNRTFKRLLFVVGVSENQNRCQSTSS